MNSLLQVSCDLWRRKSRIVLVFGLRESTPNFSGTCKARNAPAVVSRLI
jgi:hypothetical protein